jgi:hypothetical protein
VRIPSLTHRGDAQREEEARVEGRSEDRAVGRTAVRERPVTSNETPTEKIRPVPPAERVETPPEPEPVPEPRGRRGRSSLVATVALIVAVVSALGVLTGILAGYGIALGALAVLMALVAIPATRRRHVAGRSEAMLALVLGLGAVVFGVLVVTDSFSWISTTSNEVGDLRNWLDAQTVDRF